MIDYHNSQQFFGVTVDFTLLFIVARLYARRGIIHSFMMQLDIISYLSYACNFDIIKMEVC